MASAVSETEDLNEYLEKLYNYYDTLTPEQAKAYNRELIDAIETEHGTIPTNTKERKLYNQQTIKLDGVPLVFNGEPVSVGEYLSYIGDVFQSRFDSKRREIGAYLGSQLEAVQQQYDDLTPMEKAKFREEVIKGIEGIMGKRPTDEKELLEYEKQPLAVRDLDDTIVNMLDDEGRQISVGEYITKVDDIVGKGIGKGKAHSIIHSAYQKKGGGIPPERAFWKGAKNAYDKVAPDVLGDGFEKIVDTPTFDAYLRPSDKSILLASRGTNITSWSDLKADAFLVANRLRNTKRYETDAKVLQQIVQQYPPEDGYEYSIAGHSLSVAIANQLMRDFPFIRYAVGYNGAFQPADLAQQKPNIKRLYTDKDFLYNLGGKFFRKVNVVPLQEKKAQGFFARIQSALTPSGIKGHSLDNFKPLYGLGMKGKIDFGEIRWNTFTDLFNRYKRKHPSTGAKNLEEFSKLVVDNPDRFSERARKKAQFYRNIIMPKKGGSKKSGYIASLITCKNEPMSLTKFQNQSEGFQKYTKKKLTKRKYPSCQVDDDTDRRWKAYLDSLPNQRARATAQQRLRYYTAGVEGKDKVVYPRETAIKIILSRVS